MKNDTKKQKDGFFIALLAPLATSLVQPVISSVVKGLSGRGVRRAGKGHMDKFLVPLHPLNNMKIANYFKYEPRFNGVSSRNNLPRIKDGAYVINLDDKNSKGAQWVSFY